MKTRTQLSLLPLTFAFNSLAAFSETVIMIVLLVTSSVERIEGLKAIAVPATGLGEYRTAKAVIQHLCVLIAVAGTSCTQ
jgi:hypothetical protein